VHAIATRERLTVIPQELRGLRGTHKTEWKMRAFVVTGDLPVRLGVTPCPHPDLSRWSSSALANLDASVGELTRPKV
jgi:hypothetical protein